MAFDQCLDLYALFQLGASKKRKMSLQRKLFWLMRWHWYLATDRSDAKRFTAHVQIIMVVKASGLSPGQTWSHPPQTWDLESQ